MSIPIEISTERLTIRPPEPRDAAAVTALISEKDIAWNLGRAPYPYTEQDAVEWIEKAQQARAEGSEYSFVIDLEDQLIGASGVSLHFGQWELGYWVGKPYWGQGYVTEAARGVMNWARETKSATKFMAGHYTDNPASGAVLRKLGFEPVGEVTWYARARNMDVPAKRYICGDEASADIALNWHTH
ncbi:MAG: GNAT family N-acetyltransferase [Henriciella sp.]|nr:GNAT family N-acetyltransferase [Henriciella sp.]